MWIVPMFSVTANGLRPLLLMSRACPAATHLVGSQVAPPIIKLRKVRKS